MKIIVVCIPHTLLSDGIVMFLGKQPHFKVYTDDNPRGIADLCAAANADVLLVEMRERSPHTIEEWNGRVKAIKEKLSDCKALYIADENSNPDLADRVALARKDRLIDAFAYSTVTGNYLAELAGSL